MPQENSRNLDLHANKKKAKKLGDSWFLGIGINTYQNFSSLNNAVKDVRDIVQLLLDKYDLEKDYVIILENEQANRHEIIQQLEALADKIKPVDKIIIYYSGHGHLNRRGRGFWIPYDAKKDQTSTYLRNSTIRDYIKDINSLHTLLISDSCFSGTLFVRDAKRTASPFDELEQLPSRWGICSGRHDEKVSDGTPGKNSPFAESVLLNLKQNEGNAFNVGKLADRVMEQTRSNYEQLPEGNPLYGVGHQGGQYIFRRKQQLSEEEAFWNHCMAEHSIQAYSKYLRQYRSGQFTGEAIKKIKLLEDDKAWENAKRINRIWKYYDYIGSFPDGIHVEEANNKIAALEKETDAPPTPPRTKKEPPTIIPKVKHESVKAQASKFGSFTDPRDGQVYRTVELMGKTWLAQNLNFDVGEYCWFYNDDPKNGEEYGRLYTWEAAKKACPSGWRLPTDPEWRALANAYGGYRDYENGMWVDKGDPKKAYKALLDKGSSDFAALLGGGRSSFGSFNFLETDGYYWSSTEEDSDVAWLYEFNSYDGELYRYGSDKTLARSVRCIYSK